MLKILFTFILGKEKQRENVLLFYPLLVINPVLSNTIIKTFENDKKKSLIL